MLDHEQRQKLAGMFEAIRDDLKARDTSRETLRIVRHVEQVLVILDRKQIIIYLPSFMTALTWGDFMPIGFMMFAAFCFWSFAKFAFAHHEQYVAAAEGITSYWPAFALFVAAGWHWFIRLITRRR